MFEGDLKRKLRNLKKLEQRVRGQFLQRHPQAPLVWKAFFSTAMIADSSIKYPFVTLLHANRDERKRMFEEYLFAVFVRRAQEEGQGFSDPIMAHIIQNPEVLAYFGLPPYATFADIKRRFRELAHQYHPDKGGDPEKMIELLEMYAQSQPK